MIVTIYKIVSLIFLFSLLGCAGQVVIYPRGCSTDANYFPLYPNKDNFDVDPVLYEMKEKKYVVFASYFEKEYRLRNVLKDTETSCKKLKGLRIRSERSFSDVLISMIPGVTRRKIYFEYEGDESEAYKKRMAEKEKRKQAREERRKKKREDQKKALEAKQEKENNSKKETKESTQKTKKGSLNLLGPG